MEVTLKTDTRKKLTESPKQGDVVELAELQPSKEAVASPNSADQKQQQTQQPQQKSKRKHRRGKPKAKNGNKPYRKSNWRFQMPRLNYSKCASVGGSGGCNRREKLQRSRSLVPYNTNKFLMEEHLAEVPCSLLTPTGRTRDSSFSMDSEDNYFFSLPEDEEEYLTKEFANVYEKARVERLDSLSKQELIEECLQIEDRYSKDQGNQRQQQLNIQRIAQEYMAKIRALDEKVRELSRENYNLRCQLMRSAAFVAAAAASPPSAAAPMGAACQPTPMDSSSEDSESDSSTSSSSSSSSALSSNGDGNQVRRRDSCSSHSSSSEYKDYIENNYIRQNLEEQEVVDPVHNNPCVEQQFRVMETVNEPDFESSHLLDNHMDDDVDGDHEVNNDKLNGYISESQEQQLLEHVENSAGIQNVNNDNGASSAAGHLQNPLN